MDSYVPEIFGNAWHIVVESGIYILAGFLIAGFLHSFVNTDRAISLLSKSTHRSVVLAALIGAPLPLCSCSVLPAAVAMRRKGAGKGPTLSFLVATPETSVTSVLLTYSLLGPLMAVFRVVAACVTAVVAGLTANVFDNEESPSPNGVTGNSNDTAIDDCRSPHLNSRSLSRESWAIRTKSALIFGGVDLFDDLFGWIAIGIAAAAAIQTWAPADMFQTILGGPLQTMFWVILIAVPLYVCAEASTPIAATLIATGLSPGAALVFLLVGPATNIGSLGLLTSQFGKRSVLIYLGSIILSAILMGLLLNELPFGPIVSASSDDHKAILPSWLMTSGAVAFLVLGGVAACRTLTRRLTTAK